MATVAPNAPTEARQSYCYEETLIHRLGCGAIARRLPPLRATGMAVLWCCDPMHGNTRVTNGGLKTRKFGEILGEVNQASDIHRANGSRLGGVQVELITEAITECIGDTRGLNKTDLTPAYRSYLDPRLNYEQALELPFFTARKMRAMNGYSGD